MQRSVSKFTRQRSQLLSGKSNTNELTTKQKDALKKLFDTVIYHVFLPKTQCVAPPTWMAKHVKVKANGEREVTCKRGRPQLFTLQFFPATRSRALIYEKGGKFKIGGPNMPQSEIRCVALKGDEHDEHAAPQWRLENYDADDEENASELNRDSADEEVDSFANATSAEEDVEMHEPEGHILRGHDAGVVSGSDLEEENNEEEEPVEMWQGSPNENDSGEAHADCPDGNAGGDAHAQSLILRPKLKHETKEWETLHDEGWIDKLPKVSGTTLSHHKQVGAWSTRYPLDGGPRHFARHYNENRTAMSALLQCVEWMVLQHYEKTGDEKMAALHQQLQARRKLEDYSLFL